MLPIDSSYTTKSFDPVVAEVHALRAEQWARYGDDTQRWFDDLVQHQAERLRHGSVGRVDTDPMRPNSRPD
jgi:hypothetical protein